MASATQMILPAFSPQVLSNRAVIRVAGEGALAFLHNILTADLTTPKPTYAALLSPQGKILHDVFVVPEGDLVWLDVSTIQAADVLRRLIMYRLRAKLEITLEPQKMVAVSSQNDLSSLAYVDPRIPEIGCRAIVDCDALQIGAGYDIARLQFGLADSETDIGSGEMFVHEANLDQLNGVNFHKGCYVGQEVVSRTHHRHTTRNRILPVRVSADTAKGNDIMSGETRVGTMLSSEGAFGLALLRLDRLADVTAPLLTSGVKVSVQKPHWANFEMSIPEVAQ